MNIASNRLTRTVALWAVAFCLAIALGSAGCCGTCGNGCNMTGAPGASGGSYAAQAQSANKIAQNDAKPAETINEWMQLKRSDMP